MKKEQKMKKWLQRWLPLIVELVACVVWMVFGGMSELVRGNSASFIATMALGVMILTSSIWAKVGDRSSQR